ncbi:MAG: hypothetical protein CL843_02965 [Crocinitomicaceae bacterium]|nr:hypothetical protein [Crocinitomicaceae bacterium]|tara:strand:- start:555 stop:1313 length:759 start_codon:yes stop_codon:yes gene_type:complete
MPKPIALILASDNAFDVNEDLITPMVPFMSKPIIEHITDAIEDSGVEEIYIVTGQQSEKVEYYFGDAYKYIEQDEADKGLVGALKQAQQFIDLKDRAIIVAGAKAPLIMSRSIKKMLKTHQEQKNDVTFLSADFAKEFPYPRIIRDLEGAISTCIQPEKCSEEELEVLEFLSTYFVFDGNSLDKELDRMSATSGNDTYDFCGMLHQFKKQSKTINVLKVACWYELVSITSYNEHQIAQRLWYDASRAKVYEE